MAPKRKSAAPTRANESKRQAMTWNMFDGQTDEMSLGLDVIIDDTSPVADVQSNLVKDDCVNAPSTSLEQSWLSPHLADADHIRGLLDNCHFCEPIHYQLPARKKEWHCKLGEFKLHISGEQPDVIEKIIQGNSGCWLYVDLDHGNHVVYFEKAGPDSGNKTSKKNGESTLYVTCFTEVPSDCLLILSCHPAILVLCGWDKDSALLTLSLHMLEYGVRRRMQPRARNPSRPSNLDISLKRVMEHFYNIPIPASSTKGRIENQSIDELYDIVRNRHQMAPVQLMMNVQHPCLKPRLRPYQKEAVLWMLHKECLGEGGHESTAGPCCDSVKWDMYSVEGTSLYQPVTLCDGQQLFYNRYLGYLVREEPLSTVSPPGGILADEMGLGKTVEVLACMLNHPRVDLPKIQMRPVIAHKKPKKRCKNSDKNIIGTDADASNSGHQEDNVAELAKEMEFHKASTAKVNISCAGLSTMNVNESEVAYTLESSCWMQNYGCTVNEKANTDNKTDPQKASAAHMDMSCSEMSTVKEVSKSTVSKDESKSDVAYTLGSSCCVQNLNCTMDEMTNKDSTMSCPQNTDQPTPQLSPPLVPWASTQTPCNRVVATYSRRKKKRAIRAGTPDLMPARVPHILKQPAEGFKDGKFECVCGGLEDESGDTRPRAQCEKCGLWQHAECVKYDLADPRRGCYLCPHCHVAAPPIPSGATLIISPRAISHQWVEEIEKHVRQESLKVLVYSGVNQDSFIQPLTLARQDIVITSYETLRREINYVDLPHSNSKTSRRLRRAKRFMAVPSPIIAVEWWRICLDEAQMVECVTTKTAEMALRLSAVNRWCVTGTPIQRDIDDLYGLMLFLGVEPYWMRRWWSRILYEPYRHGKRDALEAVVMKVLWRTAKKDVLDQLSLPAQTEDIHWLTFSPVEEHFYRSQYNDSTDQARKNFRKWKETQTKLNSLTRRTLHQLLYPLLRLRQACCHPQAVRGEFLSIHKSTLSMAELLTQLTKKARLECEEAHRQQVAALNGLAGLHIIKQEYSEAAEKYRSVMRSVEEHKDELRTDELQQLHTLHNMDELLKGHGSAVAPTLRDSLLSQQANEVREKYLVKAAASVTVAQESWVPVHTSVSELKNQLARGSTWWADLIQWVNYRDLDMALVEKVTEDLAANATSQTHISAFRFRESLGLQFLLASHIEQLDQSHDALVNHLHMLSGPPSESVVNAAVECCLRPVAELLNNCAFCKADELFQDYESKLFSFVDKGFTQQTSQADDPMYLLSTRRQGTWADSETERALKSLNSFCKNFGADRKMTEFGNIHFKLLDALKKEFKCLRTVWKVLREQVSAMDELSMATTRIRLRLEDEPFANPPQKNILEEHKLEIERIKFVSDQIVAQCLLKKKLGQLLYLKNLAQTQDTMTGGMNPEPCPICQKELGSRWSVLQCGHCFCLECIHILVQEYSFGGRYRSLKCAICRQRTTHADISYVCTRGRKALEEEIIKVKGDNSTKIEGIVQCLLQIQQSDPTAKCLVFSTWVDVLNVLGQALSLNNIPFRSLQAGSKFQENLAVFRHDDDIKVLLLPVHSGANGLNLIEATHVLLVEPILNPAQELQAIGRVHRIGQTRSTVVHRFLVRGTIEERMHSLLQNAQSPVNCHNSSETTMTIADLMSLFEETADGGGQDDTNQHSSGQDASGQEMVGQQLPEEAMVGEEHVDEVVQTDDSIQGQGVRVQGQMEDTVIGQEVRVEEQTEDTVLGLEGRVEGQTEGTVLGQEVRVEGQTEDTVIGQEVRVEGQTTEATMEGQQTNGQLICQSSQY